MIEQNIFKITSPESYGCRINRYELGHSELYIDIRLPDLRVYAKVGFVAVEYFSGPLWWQGANFQIADFQECQSLLKTFERYRKFSEEQFAIVSRGFKLYEVPSINHNIKIVAANANLVKLDTLDF